jgi:very-short-patch-repair endonuclease
MSEAVDGLLWQLRATGLPDPVTEYAFAKAQGRRWRFDLAWPDLKVAVEVDGGGFVQGRHSRGMGIERDSEKFSTAAAHGWRVFRVTPRMVRDGAALALIEEGLGR